MEYLPSSEHLARAIEDCPRGRVLECDEGLPRVGLVEGRRRFQLDFRFPSDFSHPVPDTFRTRQASEPENNIHLILIQKL